MKFVQIYAIVLILSSSYAVADDTSTGVYDDILLLTNGASIRGLITNIIEGELVIIQREDGESFKVPWKKIEAITNEEGFDQAYQTLMSKPPPEKDIYFETHGGMNYYIRDGSTGYGLGAGLGIRWKDKRFVGLSMNRDWVGMTLWTIRFKQYFPMGGIYGYLYADAGIIEGHDLWIAPEDHPGSTFTFGFGVRSSMDSQLAIFFHLGYGRCGFEEIALGSVVFDPSFNFFTIGMGFTFSPFIAK